MPVIQVIAKLQNYCWTGSKSGLAKPWWVHGFNDSFNQYNRAEVVKVAIRQRVKLDLQVPTGPTALIIASAHGNTEIVKLLLGKRSKYRI